ncbi:MAG: DUF2147 domain-containing protein [Pseudomonadota bacterium]|nr:DUF2147 domain-containing protein [Pseudomonadota bacterium]
MQQLSKKLMIASALSLAIGGTAWADSSPVGLWKSIDDHSGKPTALIRISESGDTLQGRIEKLFDQSADKSPLCTKCSGVRKDQPILGMTIIEGMRREDGRSDQYDQGTIIDPDNGVIYRSRMSLSADGNHLHVRGYVGMPLFGRTQTWVRVP